MLPHVVLPTDGEQPLNGLVQKSDLSVGIQAHDAFTHLQEKISSRQVSLHRHESLVVELGQTVDFIRHAGFLWREILSMAARYPFEFVDNALDGTNDVKGKRHR